MPTDNLSLQVASHCVASTALHLTPLHVQRVFFCLFDVTRSHTPSDHLRQQIRLEAASTPQDQRKQSRRWHGIRFREDYRPIDKG
jgi:hypothetical protein